MAKYLDANGVDVLWKSSKNKMLEAAAIRNKKEAAEKADYKYNSIEPTYTNFVAWDAADTATVTLVDPKTPVIHYNKLTSEVDENNNIVYKLTDTEVSSEIYINNSLLSNLSFIANVGTTYTLEYRPVESEKSNKIGYQYDGYSDWDGTVAKKYSETSEEKTATKLTTTFSITRGNFSDSIAISISETNPFAENITKTTWNNLTKVARNAEIKSDNWTYNSSYKIYLLSKNPLSTVKNGFISGSLNVSSTPLIGLSTISVTGSNNKSLTMYVYSWLPNAAFESIYSFN